MNSIDQRRDEWLPCAPGSLVEFATAAREKRRRRKAVGAAGVGGLLLALGAAFWLARGPGKSLNGEYFYGGIACSDVRANLAAFQQGKLPKDLANRIEIHLAQCAACRALIEPMHREGLTAVSHQHAPCNCPNCRWMQSLAATDSQLTAISLASTTGPAVVPIVRRRNVFNAKDRIR